MGLKFGTEHLKINSKWCIFNFDELFSAHLKNAWSL